MSVHEMLQWWNVIYLAPLAVAVVWILATVLAGVQGHGFDHGAGGHDMGHDLGHGADAGAHVHSVHDLGDLIGHAMHHADAHGGHGHHDADGHGDHGGGQGSAALSWFYWVLGLDQIPVTLVVGSFMLSWGAYGLVFNQIFHVGGKYTDFVVWPSILSTFGLSFVTTRTMVAILARVLPKTETFGVSRLDLTGSAGKVVHAVGEKAGTVDISDRYGTVHRVQAKTEDKAEHIAIGSQVIVLDFDDDDKRFIVRKSTL